ncbi:sensor histidine kinase [Microbacterium alcoholitolerans]|uniref:sensor histidine kinase n=1 Tax=unclassified Microbacterium TaxID=2609290 RepID=UPI003D187390
MTAVGLALLSLEPPYVTPLWTMILLAVGGFATLTVRRRHPHIAFAAAMVLSVLSLAAGSGAESLLAFFALYDAGVRWRAAVTWMHFGIAMVAAALSALALTMRGRTMPPILGLQPPIASRDTIVDWANFCLVMAVILLVVTLLGTSVGHRRRYVGELVHRAEQLARERDQQAETARAHERERIAREMHDIIAHSLSVMIAISDGAHAASDTRPAEAKEAIARVADTGRKTLSEVRRLLGSVRGDGVAAHAPHPDASQLASLVQEFTAAGLPVRLSVTGQPPSDPALGLTVYRIVQESLTNALRHAQGVTGVDATVGWAGDEVSIVVQDVSSVVASPSDAGRGLLGMQERVALYDGEIEVGPHDGGWRVFARLRWEDG